MDSAAEKFFNFGTVFQEFGVARKTPMDSTFITAAAALGGSLLGASATIVTTWISQRAQTVHAKREARLHHAETIYGEFITEASRLAVDGLGHSLERADTFVKFYGLLGRIRLVASDPVLTAAEACVRQIIDLYVKPNLTTEQIRMAFEHDQLDPVRDFSIACRRELQQIAAAG